MTDKIKVTRPYKFDGTDMSPITVTIWPFSIKKYVKLAEIPETLQIHLAESRLGGNAKKWYINIYKDVKPLFTRSFH